MTNDELAKLDFSGWPLRDDYVMEVGRVALLWAGLENFLMTCIGKLAGFHEPLDERAYILLAHSTFPQRLDNFAALCSLLKDEFPQLADFESVVSLLKSAQDVYDVVVAWFLTQLTDYGVQNLRRNAKSSWTALM